MHEELRLEIRRCKKRRDEFIGVGAHLSIMILCYLKTEIKGCPSYGKATATAHARQRVAFNPEAELSIVKPRVQKPKRRVSLGIALNAETGEVIEKTINAGGSTVTGKRQSKRRHTMMNTTATFTRMKDAEVKKVCISRSCAVGPASR